MQKTWSSDSGLRRAIIASARLKVLYYYSLFERSYDVLPCLFFLEQYIVTVKKLKAGTDNFLVNVVL